jgi:hypothetical protein
MAEFAPKLAVFKEVKVFPFDGSTEQDITGIVTKLEFTQSISSSAWFGSMDVMDTTGLLEQKNFKIRGEEKLTFEVHTYDGKMEDPLEINARVISVTGLQISENLTGVKFTLNFMSSISYSAGLRRIRDSYTDLKASEIAERIFKKYYGNGRLVEDTSAPNERIPFDTKKFRTTDLGSKGVRKPFYVQPTEGTMRVVMPNFPPSDAMRFLSERSFSSTAPSCSYRFFETFTGFWYVTDEFLIQHGLENSQTIEEFAYNAQNSQEGDKPELQVSTFRHFSNPSRVNTVSDLKSGGYKNKVIEIDLGRRRARNIDYDYRNDANYIDMSGNKSSLKSDPHTEDFIEETFTDENARRFLVYKDYYDDKGASLRSQQYYPNIIQNRIAYQHHLGQTVVNATLNASRLDLRPGKIIKVRVPKITVENRPDAPYNEQLSGNYLITSISHQLVDDNMETNVTLAKYGWSGDYRE